MTTDIAIFLPSLEGGGTERVMVSLANGFARRGLRVDLVVGSAGGPYLSEVSTSVRLVDLKVSRIFSAIRPLFLYLRRTNPTCLLSALNYVNVVAIIAHTLARTRTRLVISERANISLLNSSRSLRATAVKALMRLTYNFPDEIIAVSHGVADDLAKALHISRDKITVIYNPVVTDTLLLNADAAFEHQWYDNKNTPVILAAGRLDPAKDFRTLLYAFARVLERKQSKLIILGEGEMRDELERLTEELGISEHVQLPGFVKNPFPWMKHSSLFVLSSASEGLPNALIQAMACGTPVVSTDCPSGPFEILEGGLWGKLVPVGDVSALENAIFDSLAATSPPPDVKKRAQDFGEERAVQLYIKSLLPTNLKQAK